PGGRVAARCGGVLDGLACGLAHARVAAVRARVPERRPSWSAGQRQAIGLAPALRADPPVLVLDERTSAVDAHTEGRMAAGLHGLRAGRTTVVFATSPLLLDRADRVVLLR
ncbi:hypothetical protein VM98_36925, partial [Streptomyces rubellomurinus subsp. indigoferus]